MILSGPQAITQQPIFNTLSSNKPIIAFDEIHKRADWKIFSMLFIMGIVLDELAAIVTLVVA